MGELLPILCGLSLGFLLLRISSRRRELVCFAASLPLGLFCSALNGELNASWFYVAADVLLVCASALAVCTVAQRLWMRRFLR
jgi:hypothetical protein